MSDASDAVHPDVVQGGPSVQVSPAADLRDAWVVQDVDLHKSVFPAKDPPGASEHQAEDLQVKSVHRDESVASAELPDRDAAEPRAAEPAARQAVFLAAGLAATEERPERWRRVVEADRQGAVRPDAVPQSELRASPVRAAAADP